MAHILVIEDEPTIQAMLRLNLEKQGYAVSSAADGEHGLAMAQELKPDLIILDLMLPGVDGLDVLRSVRRTENVPVLILTAREDEVDKVVGLELGADDYVTKPFGLRELMARVKAMLRRAQTARPTPNHDQDEVLRFGNLEVNLGERQVTLDGRSVALKRKEFDLLHFLASHPGRVFGREELLERVWGYDFAGGSRTVDVHVRWLRQKIEASPAAPVRIETVRGVGYRFSG